MDEKWWHKSVVYQVYTKSFYDSNGDGIGDIKGIIEKLPYLAALGVDVLWLSPVYQSPQEDNGYDISDYYQIMKDYGTMEDMKRLIRLGQKHGIKILMDLVVNHTSDEHRWFQESKKSRDNPYHDFYIWRDEPNELCSNFGGSAWEYVSACEQYYLHFYSKKQPDLNWENEAVRQEIWQMMNFWISQGIGGFRMDVIDLIGKQPDQGIKENGPFLHQYIQEMNQQTFGQKDLLTVGETWGATPEIGRLYSNPEQNELSMIFQFEQIQLDKIPGCQRWDLKPLQLTALKQVFSKWQTELEGVGWNSLFWNNHDLPRIVSRWGNDQEFRVESAKMLATLLHGMKGTPYIYQGEEIGMTNAYFQTIDDFHDIETRQIYQERLAQGYPQEQLIQAIQAKARDNARTPMQWNDEKNGGFTKGQPWYLVNPNYKDINVRQALVDKNSIFYHYKKLIGLRKSRDIMVYGRYELLNPEDESVYAYTRTLGAEKWLIVCNFYEKPAAFSYEGVNNGKKILLSNYQDSSGNLDNLILRPYEAIIYELFK